MSYIAWYLSENCYQMAIFSVLQYFFSLLIVNYGKIRNKTITKAFIVFHEFAPGHRHGLDTRKTNVNSHKMLTYLQISVKTGTCGDISAYIQTGPSVKPRFCHLSQRPTSSAYLYPLKGIVWLWYSLIFSEGE